jgi:heme A synthase
MTTTAPTYLPTHLPTAIPSQSPTAPTPFNCTQAVLWQTGLALALALLQVLVGMGFVSFGIPTFVANNRITIWVLTLPYYIMILVLVLLPLNATSNCQGYTVNLSVNNTQTQLGAWALGIATTVEIVWMVTAWFWEDADNPQLRMYGLTVAEVQPPDASLGKMKPASRKRVDA